MSIALSTQVAKGSTTHWGIARQRRWALAGSYAALTLFVAFFLVPPFYMLVTSLKTSAEISAISGNPWFVRHPTLSNYLSLITASDFQGFFFNSVKVTACVVAISIVVSVLAAFGLTRMRFWGCRTLATCIFLVYLIPETLLFIPLSQLISTLHLGNNAWAMVVLFPTIAVPFCTWIMIGYFSSIPRELDEAALIDGASWMQILIRIFVPVAMPGIIAAMIFVFTVSWGAFLYPMAFLYSADQQVLTVGIVSSLIRGDVFQWGRLMAGSLLAAAPPVIIYVFLMDYYVGGLTAGATKD
jgi:multiple sugar transport system permease protein